MEKSLEFPVCILGNALLGCMPVTEWSDKTVSILKLYFTPVVSYHYSPDIIWQNLTLLDAVYIFWQSFFQVDELAGVSISSMSLLCIWYNHFRHAAMRSIHLVV